MFVKGGALQQLDARDAHEDHCEGNNLMYTNIKVALTHQNISSKT